MVLRALGLLWSAGESIPYCTCAAGECCSKSLSVCESDSDEVIFSSSEASRGKTGGLAIVPATVPTPNVLLARREAACAAQLQMEDGLAHFFDCSSSGDEERLRFVACCWTGSLEELPVMLNGST